MITEDTIDRIMDPEPVVGGAPSTQYALLSDFAHGVKDGAYVHVGDLIRLLEFASQKDASEYVTAPEVLRAFAELMRNKAQTNFGNAAEVA